MWSYEHSARTTATRETLWSFFEDVAGWPTWNDGIEPIVLNGSFATGATFQMTPPGEQTLHSRLIDVRPLEGFTDVTELGGVRVTVYHGPACL